MSSVVDQLSSQVGDRTENANRQVASRCLADPSLLSGITHGLTHKNAALTGDCAEVLTLVAEQHPEWVAPHASTLSALLHHKTTRVRWEAMHTLALVTASAPAAIAPLLPVLATILDTDASVIVRDYATDVLANYATTGVSAAETAYPLLQQALTVWNGKHAAHALNGLIHVAALVPALHDDLRLIGEEYTNSGRAVVRKAATRLLRVVKSPSSAPG